MAGFLSFLMPHSFLQANACFWRPERAGPMAFLTPYRRVFLPYTEAGWVVFLRGRG